MFLVRLAREGKPVHFQRGGSSQTAGIKQYQVISICLAGEITINTLRPDPPGAQGFLFHFLQAQGEFLLHFLPGVSMSVLGSP